ncbi:MAG TPA: hypothetical protein VJ600_04550, partial [Holophagaceae bacterium]|nr:hypothetical protein [Holophagaceae bacterium]
RLQEMAVGGLVADRDEVALGAMVSGVAFKTNKDGLPWAILQVEDTTGKMEVLLMAKLQRRGKPGLRPFDQFRSLALPDALLRITGELKVETVTANDEEDEDKTVIKLFATQLEDLTTFQGQGFTGAVITLPPGECPPQLFRLLAEHKGSLPLFFDYRSKDGLTARVKAGPDLKLKHDPDLAEKLAKVCGCGLSWMY